MREKLKFSSTEVIIGLLILIALILLAMYTG